MAVWRKTKPATSTRVVSAEVRGNMEAIDEALLGASALAQSTPDLTVAVSAFEWLKSDGTTRASYAGGTSPTITAPGSNPRIAVLTIDDAGTLAWTYGTEGASPTSPAYPADKLPIIEVYQRVAMTAVKDADDGSQGYIRRQATRLRAIKATATATLDQTLTNRSGTTVDATDVGVLSSANDDSVVTTTTEADLRPVYIAQATIADTASGAFRRLGSVSVKVAAAVTRGNYLVTSTTAKNAKDSGVPHTLPPPAGAFAVARTGSGGAGSVTAELSGITSPGATIPRAYLAGLGLANNGADANNDVDIAAGQCRDSTDIDGMILAATLTKRLDAAWAVGTNQGGMDTGTEAASTWYHVWLVKRSDTGVVDALFSLSATAPTMPANYDRKRRLGAVRNSSGSALLAFIQQGDRVRLTTSVADISATNPGTAAVTRTLTVPTGVIVLAHILAAVDWGTSPAGKAYVSPLDATDEVPTNALLNVGGAGSGSSRMVPMECYIKTNTSAQLRSRLSVSGVADIFTIQTLGWIDRRGQDD